MRGGGSTSEISICSMDLEKSSAEKGMLQKRRGNIRVTKEREKRLFI